MCNDITDERKSQSRILRKVFIRKKQNEHIIDNLLCLGEVEKAQKIRECGTFLRIFQPFEGGKSLIQTANFCRQRMCVVCAWRRSKRFIATTAPVLEYIHREQNGTENYIFLTLTLQNVAQNGLKKAIDDILSGWRNLTRQKAYKTAVWGACRSLEITYNASENTYHPHIHALLLMNSEYFDNVYYTQKQWCDMWKKAADVPYKPILDVRAIKDITKDIHAKGAVIETFKYSMKPNDLSFSPEVTGTLMHTLAGRRLISFTGHIAEIRKKLRIEDFENTLCDTIGEQKGYSILYHFTPSGWEIIDSPSRAGESPLV